MKYTYSKEFADELMAMLTKEVEGENRIKWVDSEDDPLDKITKLGDFDLKLSIGNSYGVLYIDDVIITYADANDLKKYYDSYVMRVLKDGLNDLK